MTKIEIICESNWRPGMISKGWLVRYSISDYGWKCMKCFTNYIDAVNFYNSKVLEEIENS